MTLIHAIDDQIVTYPDSMDALRKAHPNVSFPVQPTDEDLAAFNRYRVARTSQPAHDARTERVDEADPVLTEDGWQQVWTVRDATEDEITAWDIANAPAPQWVEFGIQLAISPSFSEVYDQLPSAIANGLSIGLNEASKGNATLFTGLWQKVLELNVISDDLLLEITELAEQCHLPTAFIDSLYANNTIEPT